MGRGELVKGGAGPGEIAAVLNGKLGDGNIQPRGIGLGAPSPGGLVGRIDAVYAVVKTSAAAGNVYDVSHSLGRVPSIVLLIGSENSSTPASHYSVIAWERQKWTHSTMRVRVVALVGSLDGGVITLLVGGD